MTTETKVEAVAIVCDWREVDKELFDAVGGEPHEGADFRCEYCTLYTLRQEKPE